MKHLLCASAVALVAAAASPTSFAAPCGGFTDVDDTAVGTAFCQNVEWVKNRGVAFGCTGTTYCPNDPVTRLQMAAFMNRLGTALTPVHLRKRQTGAQLGALNFNTTQTVCVTDPVAPPFDVAVYPRTAVITALLNAFTPSDANFTLQAQLVFSTNNGATWQAVPAGDGFAYGTLYKNVPGTSTLFAPPMDVSMRAHTTMDVNPGTSYRFAVQGLAISPTGGSSAVAQTYCELHATIENRNGTSSPFDPMLDGLPPGR